MRLTSGLLPPIKHPTDDHLVAAICSQRGDAHSFAILSDPPIHFFLQCSGNPQTGFVLEYSQSGQLHRVSGGLIDANVVFRCFQRCLAGESDWNRGVRWVPVAESAVTKPARLSDPQEEQSDEPWIEVSRGNIQFTRRTVRWLMRIAGISLVAWGFWSVWSMTQGAASPSNLRHFRGSGGLIFLGGILLYLSFRSPAQKRGYNE